MKKPIVGVIGNGYRVEDRYQTQLAGEANLAAVAQVADALPLIFAGNPDVTNLADLLDAVDGILLTGARANVHPTNFATEPSEAYANGSLGLPDRIPVPTKRPLFKTPVIKTIDGLVRGAENYIPVPTPRPQG